MTPVLAFNLLVTVQGHMLKHEGKGATFSEIGKNAQKYAKIGNFCTNFERTTMVQLWYT